MGFVADATDVTPEKMTLKIIPTIFIAEGFCVSVAKIVNIGQRSNRLHEKETLRDFRRRFIVRHPTFQQRNPRSYQQSYEQ